MSKVIPLSADELAAVFGYTSKRGVNRAIRLGTFPIPTFIQNGRRFAHADHVYKYLAEKKVEAESEFGWIDA